MNHAASPLWEALTANTEALERLLVRGGQAAGLVCVLLSVWVSVALGAAMGPWLVILALATFSVYTVVIARWDHPSRPAVVRWVLPSIEATLPAAVMWVMHETQGPAYALGSWVPPQLYACFVLMSMLRLDARLPVWMGIWSALGYAAVTFGVVLPSHESDELLHQPAMQITRMVALLSIGGASSLAVRRLMRTIDAAGRAMRAKELFGKYRLGDDIASGGMGRVVEALYCPEGGFQRRVAIKLIHPHLARDARFVERFRVEAELTSRLHHPGIVAALDFGRADDTWFFVMEYVDGPPLAELLHDHRAARLPIEPRLVLAMGLMLCEALDHAHARATDATGKPLRVLHRDLTPSNILVDRSGQLKISDFGVARALGAEASMQTKNLVGKPSYVAPEALKDQPVDERADLWSLGVVLWESLTNERLFRRTNEAATLLAVLEDAPPALDAVRPGLGAAWQLFFDRALARDPKHRFPSALAMRDALIELQRVEGRATLAEVAALLAHDAEELPLDPTAEIAEG